MINKEELIKLEIVTNSNKIVFNQDKIELKNPFQTNFNLVLDCVFDSDILVSCKIDDKQIINNDNFNNFKISNLADVILRLIIIKSKNKRG